MPDRERRILFPAISGTSSTKYVNFLLTDSRLDKFTLRKEAPENLPEVSADPDMLYQAFLNILINAVIAMPEVAEKYESP